MSHSARINGLTNDLVRHIFGENHAEEKHSDHAFEKARAFAQKGVKSSQYARVNQFEVNGRLHGLVEKFAVINNESLSEALKSRLEELSSVSNKITPELLALFLELSDRPSEQYQLPDLDDLPSLDPEPSLTWDQILAEDPYSDEELWKDFETGSEVSADDHYVHIDDVTASQRRALSSPPAQEDLSHVLQEHTLECNSATLNGLRHTLNAGVTLDVSCQPKQRHSSDETALASEIQIVREILHIVRGYPSSLLDSDISGQRRSSSNFCTSSISPVTLHAIIAEFSDIASQLQSLRIWCRARQQSALRQRYQSAVSNKLKDFDAVVSILEGEIVHPESDTVVSIQHVSSRLQIASSSLLRLYDLVATHDSNAEFSWSLLEHVYKECCLAQTLRDDAPFRFFADIFFTCLPAYLDPLRLWISEGMLKDSDNLTFVVPAASLSKGDRTTLWHSQYHLRSRKDGSIAAPTFLQDLAKRIFATGKAVMFLHAVNSHGSEADFVDTTKVDLTFDSVCGPLQNSHLWSFQELVHTALQRWIGANARSKPILLRNVILKEHGLLTFLRSLPLVFLSQNGYSFQTFATTLFDRLATQRVHWHDPFVLTSLAQTTFARYLASSDQLSVRIQRKSCKASSDLTRQLPRVKLHYAIPWQLQNIIREPTPATFEAIFVLLLQISRVQYLLSSLTITLPTRLREAESGTPQALGLKQVVLWYSLTLQNHICQTTQQTVAKALSDIEKSAGIDEMSKVYAAMNKRLLRQSLSTPELMMIKTAIVDALDIAEGLYKTWNRSALSGQAGVGVQEDAEENDGQGETDEGEDMRDEESKPSDPAKEIEALRRAFDRHLDFAVAGLRSIARVGGEESWVILVEKLDMRRSEAAVW